MTEQTTQGESINDNLEERTLGDDRNAFIKATDIYFKPKFFEKSGRIYEWLGVKPFKKLLMGTIGRAFRSAGMDDISWSYFIGRGSNKDVSHYETLARISETVHMPLTILAGSALAPNVAEGDITNIIGASMGILINGYCTMLQRYNRARAYRILEKKGER